jgi:hypothetical protein
LNFQCGHSARTADKAVWAGAPPIKVQWINYAYIEATKRSFSVLRQKGKPVIFRNKNP